MKNIIEILKSQNIELNDEQSKAIEKEVSENYKTIADYQKQKDKLDVANTQLKDTRDAFEEFKKDFDGVDVNDLKGKVNTLTQQLADKDNESQSKLNDLEMRYKAKDGLRGRNCIDVDLAMTQIDFAELAKSKNQDEDLEKILDGIQENKKMLFQEQEPKPIGGINIGGGTGGSNIDDYDNKLRMAMGLEPTKGE